MERFTLDFSAPNIITIGLVGLLFWAIVVGGWNIAFSAGNPSKTAPAA